MEVIDFHTPPPGLRVVAALGVFDGLHRGHQEIINQATMLASRHQAKALVISFDPHPVEVLRETWQPRLMGRKLKEMTLSELGVDYVTFIPFNRELAQLEPEAFIEILCGMFELKGIVVGENFRFGKQAIGDIDLIDRLSKDHGFQPCPVPLVLENQERISTTRVRKVLEKGLVDEAAGLLGRFPAILGMVIKGAGRGRTLGIPTLNLDTDDLGMVPADGVYGGQVYLEGSRVKGQGARKDIAAGSEIPRNNIEDDIPSVIPRSPNKNSQSENSLLLTPYSLLKYKAAISIGTQPTFEGTRRIVEAHLLDFNEDIYGMEVKLEFDFRIREQMTFDSKEALIEQIHKDIELVRETVATISP